ncbi:NCS2 family permease [Cetobacterium sp. SF1]|uniref:NCS2 family permease n=1 Tax=Cetobacterium sp. SF1 TaxID=3417654 RepID=UPI003CF96414
MESLKKFAGVEERGSTVKTELIAGLTTFMTMAYILAVVPGTLSKAGVPFSGAFAATAISACLATFFAGLANFPFGLGPSLGMNAFFVFSVVLGKGHTWQFALTAVAISGILLLILTVTKIREKLFNVIPFNLKMAMIAGIGLFITLIGLASAGIVVPGAGTVVALGNLKEPRVFLSLIGLILTGVLMYKNVKGALFWGIIVTTIIGFPLGVTKLPTQWEIMPDLASTTFKFVGMDQIMTVDMAIAVFTFLFVAIFDTVGTLIGLAGKANLLDKNDELPGVTKACLCDSFGTIIAGCLGTSLVGTFVESAAGISEGGKTGLTAFTTSFLFLIALFLAPVFIMIPAAATAPVLIIVGLLMVSAIKAVNFDDMTEGLPAFLTIVLMPLTYSIAEGIVFGIIAYVAIKLLTNRVKDVTPVMAVLAVLFVLKIAFM